MALMFGVASAAAPEFIKASARIGGCSGTIFATVGDQSYGVSAAHCASGVGRSVQFDLPSGKSGKAVWLFIDRRVDMSLFRVPSEKVDVVYAIKESPTLGEYISCGYPKGRGPRLIPSKFLGEAEINSLPVPRWEFDVDDTSFGKGCSGGGLFSDGSLVGVVTHGSDDNDEMFSSTHSQLIAFVRDAEKSLKLTLLPVKKDEEKGFEYDGIPLGSDIDRTKAIVHILNELKRARGELERIRRTPIRVQILDPKTGKILQEQAYPFGTPIKLLLPTLKR